MKKFITGLVIISFLIAAMPQLANAGHYYNNYRPYGHYGHHHNGGKNALIELGIVGAVVGVVVWAVSRDKTSVAIEEIKANSASNARNACGGLPCESGYDSSTAGSSKIWYQPTVQPIAQNVRPRRSDNGESALCRAGREAALNEISMACESNATDYCLCYNEAKEGR